MPDALCDGVTVAMDCCQWAEDINLSLD